MHARRRFSLRAGSGPRLVRTRRRGRCVVGARRLLRQRGHRVRQFRFVRCAAGRVLGRESGIGHPGWHPDLERRGQRRPRCRQGGVLPGSMSSATPSCSAPIPPRLTNGRSRSRANDNGVWSYFARGDRYRRPDGRQQPGQRFGRDSLNARRVAALRSAGFRSARFRPDARAARRWCPLMRSSAKLDFTSSTLGCLSRLSITKREKMVEVLDMHAQQVIHLARHRITSHHFGPGVDRRAECVDRRFALGRTAVFFQTHIHIGGAVRGRCAPGRARPRIAG